MQRVNQKDLERPLFELFRRKWGEFPDGEVQESETPDFLIKGPARCVGIEVTRLYAPKGEGSPLQQYEGLEQLVVGRALELHRKAAGPPLHVVVTFSGGYQFDRRRCEGLSEAVFAIVRDHLPTGRQMRVKVEDDWRGANRLPREIHTVDIWRFPGVTASCWSVSRGGWVNEITPEIINPALENKAKRYPACRLKCDEVWLLVVFEGVAQSSLFEPGYSPMEHKFVSPFDRVFLLDGFGGAVTELMIRPA